MKNGFKTIINRMMGRAGLRIYNVSAHGREDVNDLRRVGGEFKLILDVGANIGQSVRKFHAAFPRAVIHAFEPVAEVFSALKSNVGGMPRVRLHEMAMGESAGQAPINIRAQNTTHTLAPADDSLRQEMVEVQTVDRFMAAEKIQLADLLKIDTEGFDLQVLKGAERSLRAGIIRFILVECGFTLGETRVTPFDAIRDYLHPLGYRLFGIYEQQPDYGGAPMLRYANACFCLQPTPADRHEAPVL